MSQVWKDRLACALFIVLCGSCVWLVEILGHWLAGKGL